MSASSAKPRQGLLFLNFRLLAVTEIACPRRTPPDSSGCGTQESSGIGEHCQPSTSELMRPIGVATDLLHDFLPCLPGNLTLEKIQRNCDHIPMVQVMTARFIS